MRESELGRSWGDLLGQIHPNLTYRELLSLSRQLKQLNSKEITEPERVAVVKTKIALVGNNTLSFACAPLEVFLAKQGIKAEWFVGEYNNYQQELLSDDSPLYAFEPQVVILALDHRAVHFMPEIGAVASSVSDAAERQVREWDYLWSKVKTRCGASVIQLNITLPHEQIFGHYEAKAAWGPTNFLRRINQLIAERAPSHVYICDTEQLSNRIGKRNWFHEPTWYTTRQAFGFEALVTLTYSLAAIVGTILGKSRKCLVLDLDNTLWGDVIGDVGVEGIKLGQGDPLGEAFIDFQTYCRRLKERGVVLAVCSKNNYETACTPFKEHPEMVLKLNDFGAFIANWEDKATNLKRIALELNLGTDSIVFVDDNPAERALVKKYLPEVAVPEMPSDPALYRRVLDEHHYFEILTLSQEDLTRTSYYLVDKKRKQQELATNDISDFLKSLEQECEVGPFDEINLQRIVQLINKTNQWNLTTQRLTEGEVRGFINNPSYHTYWVRHRDKFGDSGLISVVIAEKKGSEFDIQTWLMSCRVINRGIEDYLFNRLLEDARRLETTLIVGTYKPTKKNVLVSGLYENFGFKYQGVDDDGASKWLLPLTENVTSRSCFIREAGSDRHKA
ncbi:MAG: HAD-IIIC family phosphatase [bacterium]